MTVEQYLALDESSDAKYEYLDGYVFLLRPPSSAYDDQAVDIGWWEYRPCGLVCTYGIPARPGPGR